jgi:uncharacterized protein
MIRILVWVALAILVFAAIRSKLRGFIARQNGAVPPGRPAGPARAPEAIETMACCAHCHMHFPVSEAVRADGLDYCSPAHVRLPPV